MPDRRRRPPARILGTTHEMFNLAEPAPTEVKYIGSDFWYFMDRRRGDWLDRRIVGFARRKGISDRRHP